MPRGAGGRHGHADAEAVLRGGRVDLMHAGRPVHASAAAAAVDLP